MIEKNTSSMSVLSTFEQYLQVNIFPAIIEFYSERGVTATEEELSEHLSMSKVKPPSSKNGVPSTISATKGRKVVYVDTLQEGYCNYQLARGGINKGKYCPHKAAPGSDRCKSCQTKKGGSAAPAPKTKKTDKPSSHTTETLVDPSTITLASYKDNKLYGLNRASGFVFDKERGVVVGYDEDGTFHTMNEEKEEKANNLGFTCVYEDVVFDEGVVSEADDEVVEEKKPVAPMKPKTAPSLAKVGIAVKPKVNKNVKELPS